MRRQLCLFVSFLIYLLPNFVPSLFHQCSTHFIVNLCYVSALLLLLSALSLTHRQAEVTKKSEYSGLVAFSPPKHNHNLAAVSLCFRFYDCSVIHVASTASPQCVL